MGVYGRWLREHDVVYQSGDIAFVHGGLSPNLSFTDLNGLNDQMRAALREFDAQWESFARRGIIWRYMTLEEAVVEVQRERAALPERETENRTLNEDLQRFVALVSWLVSQENAIWYRGLAADPEEALGPRLELMLARMKINYIVAGHTVLPGFEIRQRFGNRVFLIDTGMLTSAFGGKASALEIQGGRFTAHTIGAAPRPLAPGENASERPAAVGQPAGAAQQ
jgi:hypothetical protein